MGDISETVPRVDDDRQPDFFVKINAPAVPPKAVNGTNGHHPSNGHAAVTSSQINIPPQHNTAPRVLDPQSPFITARLFLEDHHTQDGTRILQHHQATFMRWTGTHYAELPDEQARADIYDFLNVALVEGKRGELLPFKPTSPKVNNVIDATRAVAQVRGEVSAPAWLGDPPFPASETIACANGLLHLPTGRTIPHSPYFYSLSCLDYAHDPKAPLPQHWLEFLNSIWGADQEPQDALQEIFGYFLGNDTNQQKIPMLVGPLRCGKGTIARVLRALIGDDSVGNPTMNSLRNNFGLEPLINKKLAIIADARIASGPEGQVVAERLLSISGEDAQTIDRKNKIAWTGKMPTRFLIMSNELPQIGDAAGALARRFIILTMTRSYYGQEDIGLTERLLSELPGILNWAIEGWKRLRARGRFVVPQSSEEAMQELLDLSSPVSTFLRECCEEGAGTVAPDLLFQAWQMWCRQENRDHPGTKQSFGRQLKAAKPWLTQSSNRVPAGKMRVPEDPAQKRKRSYQGLALKAEVLSKLQSQPEPEFDERFG